MIARLSADAARLAVQGRGHGRRSGRSSSNTGAWPSSTCSSGAAEKAVELAREIVNREQAELVVGKGTVADVAEAQQRLEQFSLDLVTRTSDVITTERQLRNILGLPPADNRRIIPVTPPTEARLEPDWDSSLAQMVTFQPDIVQQQLAGPDRRTPAPDRAKPVAAAVEPELCSISSTAWDSSSTAPRPS